eukprot:CAMPEP_0174697810 /NCGR_PEP_ID=MMETSP1094-20130205/3575_1 /TAXON_ID=156173 /ORGANISM="Chrysochromulina brevifilum, Strain UTEX LB 985" /LENGTH=136 /DNA_ID=CAMNT_0015894867 /DNA_START=459 /DNA_END=866 /DNA_ORIENTATION=-
MAAMDPSGWAVIASRSMHLDAVRLQSPTQAVKDIELRLAHVKALCSGLRDSKRLGHGAALSMHLPWAGYGRGEEKRGQTHGSISGQLTSGEPVKVGSRRKLAPNPITVQQQPSPHAALRLLSHRLINMRTLRRGCR